MVKNELPGCRLCPTYKVPRWPCSDRFSRFLDHIFVIRQHCSVILFGLNKRFCGW